MAGKEETTTKESLNSAVSGQSIGPDDSEIGAIHAHVARIEQDVEYVLDMLPFVATTIVGCVLLGIVLMTLVNE